MTSDSSGLYMLLILMILGGGYFAGAEISFASANKIRLKNYADDGDDRAKKALYILDNFDNALTTLLIGNNIMHIGCASLATLIATRQWGVSAVAYSTVVVTIVVFLISEMIPKSFAKSNPEQFALSVASSLNYLMKILKPIAFFFTLIGKGASNLFGYNDDPSITEDELYEMIETITDEGSVSPHKSQLLHSAFAFGDIKVGDVLTSREDIAALSIDMSNEEILRFIKEEKYSRIPVYEGTIDNIVGLLQIRKYLKTYLKNGEKTILKDLLDTPHFVHSSTYIDELITIMSNKKVQISIVIDDSFKTVGLVSVEDLIEELVGEIWDEDDMIDEKFKKLGGKRFEISGDISVSSAFDLMHYQNYECERIGHKAIGRWALEQLHGNLVEGSSFQYNNLRFTVKKIDHQKFITKLVAEIKTKK